MASLFTHAVVGAAIGYTGSQELRKDWRFWVAVVACSILPDVDSLGFHMGVPYGALWGHRGMTHSLLFALIVAVILALLLDRRFHQQWRLTLLLFLVTASHGVLDAMTNGGLGVAFFSPFDTQRFFFPWRPIPVSPHRNWRVFHGTRSPHPVERNPANLVSNSGCAGRNPRGAQPASYEPA